MMHGHTHRSDLWLGGSTMRLLPGGRSHMFFIKPTRDMLYIEQLNMSITIKQLAQWFESHFVAVEVAVSIPLRHYVCLHFIPSLRGHACST